MRKNRRILSKQQAQFYIKSYPHVSGELHEAPKDLFAKDRQRLEQDEHGSDDREDKTADSDT